MSRERHAVSEDEVDPKSLIDAAELNGVVLRKYPYDAAHGD